MSSDSELIVSVSGVRGWVGGSLTPQVVLAFASALGQYLDGGRVVVSRDGRPSGSMLRHAVLAGLTAAGCEVHDLDIAATPTTGFAVRTLQAAGAVQITASHNPAPWNGLKLFGGDCAVLSAGKGRDVKQLFDAAHFTCVPHDKLGHLHDCSKASAWHRERVLELVDVARIRGRRFHTLLDANGGAGGPLGRSLLEALQPAPPVVQGDRPDGHFAHPPEPLAENLQSILPLIPQAGADA